MQQQPFGLNTLLLGLVSSALLFGTLTALAPVAAYAQDSASSDAIEEVVVTGYRKSLQNSTDAKRDSVTFSDKIFAEDIGKFPDSNIAILQPHPGITTPARRAAKGSISPYAVSARTSRAFS